MNATDLNALSLTELFDQLVPRDELDRLIAAAKREDLGEAGDITSRICLPADLHATAVVRARRAGCLAGSPLIAAVANAYDPALHVEPLLHDGQPMQPGDDIARISGPLRSLLAAERVLLNFLTHLSGIATLTRQYVDVVADTAARIYDTRKTVPGLRHLAKYAVRCGGGFSHRIGLHDAVLIKDNHLAGFGDQPLDEALRLAIAAAAKLDPPPAFVEVEVDTLDQLQRVLQVPGVDIVLLDNMNPQTLGEVVAMRDEHQPNVQLEASGGVALPTLHEIARTGVERIAVGALTHSAPALDIALDLQPIQPRHA